MTRITSFTIEGLAGRKDTVRHELNGDVNIFWGANGSGKTSALKLLHCALANDVYDLRAVAFESARVEFISETRGRLVRTIKRKAVDEAYPSESEETWRDDSGERILVTSTTSEAKWRTTPSSAEASDIRFMHRWLPISRVVDPPSRSPRKLPGQRSPGFDLDRAFAEAIERRWLDWRFKATREIRAAQDNALAEVLDVALRGVRKRDSTIKHMPADQAYKLVTEFFNERTNPRMRLSFRDFREFERRYNEDSILPDIVQRLRKVEVIVSEILHPQTRLESMIRELFSAGREIQFTDDGISVEVYGKNIPLGYLSSGERQLMMILLQCLGSGTSTMLIDEPELSMHVAWQNRLISCMQTVNPDSQLIVATHSPEIMAELEDRCVIEL